MQLLSPGFVARFPNRIVNVHPALLPSFPGLDAIGQALEHGVQGDRGERPLRRRGGRFGPGDPAGAGAGAGRTATATALEEAIHRTEHELYPQAIRMIAEGRVRIDRRNPRLVLIDE